MVIKAHIIVNRLIMHSPGGASSTMGYPYMVVGAHIIVNGRIMHSPGVGITNDELWPASSSNSVGVAIS